MSNDDAMEKVKAAIRAQAPHKISHEKAERLVRELEVNNATSRGITQLLLGTLFFQICAVILFVPGLLLIAAGVENLVVGNPVRLALVLLLGGLSIAGLAVHLFRVSRRNRARGVADLLDAQREEEAKSEE